MTNICSGGLLRCHEADYDTQMQTVAKYRAPWAVKSGGHASNPGFSSTTGVHISLANLTQVTLSTDKSTVELGFGLVSYLAQ